MQGIYCMHQSIMSSNNAGAHWVQRPGYGKPAVGGSAVNQQTI